MIVKLSIIIDKSGVGKPFRNPASNGLYQKQLKENIYQQVVHRKKTFFILPTNKTSLFLLLPSKGPELFCILDGATSFTNGLAKLDRQFQKLTRVMFARHHVLSCKQGDDESASDFFKRLRLLVEKCECSDLTIQEHKDILLCDGSVSGQQSDIIRSRLLELTNAEASLDKCKSMATAIEMSTEFSRSFVASGSSTSDSSQVVSLQFMTKETKDNVERTRSFPRLRALSVSKTYIRGSNVLLKIHPV